MVEGYSLNRMAAALAYIPYDKLRELPSTEQREYHQVKMLTYRNAAYFELIGAPPVAPRPDLSVDGRERSRIGLGRWGRFEIEIAKGTGPRTWRRCSARRPDRNRRACKLFAHLWQVKFLPSSTTCLRRARATSVRSTLGRSLSG